ncbi:hypothetical protein ACFO0S_07890 [Chryseomicrobium palamuruense]|uniref:Uncharacterized protein n=1 Tax=Chryseomicrobium palamuruense TaxID=682973 RepID=A0ABV8UUF6_9BACL
MTFHLPFLISILLFVIQAHLGLTYRLRATVMTAIVYTSTVFIFFNNHDLVFINYLFLIMFWGVAFATFQQRNSWKKVQEV